MYVLRGRGDVVGTSVYAFLFSVGSGMAGVALPLVALNDGLGAAEIGVAATVAALVQIVVRACLGRVMRRMTDRSLLVTAALAQLAALVTVLASSSLGTLTAAWTMQGIARACFWTCGQTHVVRGSGRTVGVLARFNFVAGVGQFIGPVVAGYMGAADLTLALAGGIGVSLAAVAPAVILERHDPFLVPEHPGALRLLKNRDMRLACWGSVGAGTWRSLMDSFVPVVLDSARYSATMIGTLVSVSNGAAVLGALVVGRMRESASTTAYAWAMTTTAAGMGAIGLVLDNVAAACAALVMSGLAAGLLQTLSPALATSSAGPNEQGEAIALSGTSRAVAMFAAPLAVTVAAAFVPVSAGLSGISMMLLLPALMERRARSR